MLRFCARRGGALAGIGLSLALWATWSLAGDAEETPEQDLLRVVIPPLEESAKHHTVYFPQLLDLALSKTEASDGPYVLESYPHLFTNARFLAELRRNGIVNVMWTMLDEQRVEELLPVPISLLRGLNSYRIFLIRDGDQEQFAAVETLDDLRALRAGQGAHWPDTQVLENNRLPVVTSAHYELLFNMLAGNRYDYFPRGLYEIWEEHRLHQDKGLAIEQTLMFYYPAPIYFFVSRDNPELADRIERGLRKAIEDGSFDELFFSIPGFAKGYGEMTNVRRQVFELEHPLTDIPHEHNVEHNVEKPSPQP